MRLFRIAAFELHETWRRPGRLLGLLNPVRVRRSLRAKRIAWLASGEWSPGDGGVAVKHFASYDDYLRVQRSKLEHLDLDAHERAFRSALAERLAASGLVKPGSRVLCLGARRGAEVAAFRDLGAFAIGVDLNPGPDNPWVLHGDFHDLAFPDGVVDVVYSNSLDHCFDLGQMMGEVRRLLSSDGRLIVEADPGVSDENAVEPDLWASFQWPTVTALSDRITACGFQLATRQNFDYPRGGTCLVFAPHTP